MVISRVAEAVRVVKVILRVRLPEGLRLGDQFVGTKRRQVLVIPAANITFITSAKMNQYRPNAMARAAE
jgi:hypothetical protein